MKIKVEIDFEPIEIDKTKYNDWEYVKSLPVCNIEYEQGKYKNTNYEAIQIINELLKTDLKDIICYVYDMGYDDGMEDVVDSIYNVNRGDD